MKENIRQTSHFSLSKSKFCSLFFYAVLLSSIATFPAQAQEHFELSNPTSVLDARLGKENLPVFNGIRFYDLFKSDTENFRYFNKYKPYQASITYNGQVYDSILTRYDLLTDHLIIYSEGKLSFFQVQLANEKVNAFHLDGLFFERLDLSRIHNVDKNAFYEVAYAGLNLRLYVAWSKTEKLKTRAVNSFYTFKLYKAYYLKKGAEYFNIDSMKDITQIFPERKEETKEFFKVHRQLNKRNPKQFMQKLTFYLDKDMNN